MSAAVASPHGQRPTAGLLASFFAVLAFLAVLPPRPLHAASNAEIAARLSELLDSAPANTTVSLYVENAETAELVFAYEPDTPVLPASNQKVITTAAALHYLGENFRYRTDVLYRGTVEGETLDGDLIVVGAGDPTISGRFTEDRADAAAVLRQMAANVRARGITRITGAVIGDDDAFDDEVRAPGWPSEQATRWYCAEVSALTLNDNCVDVTWRGAPRPAVKPTCSFRPETSHLQLINDISTRAGRSEGSRWYRRADGPNALKVSGTVPVGRSVTDSVAVANATLFFASAFRHCLENEGIRVDGGARDIDEFDDKTPYREDLRYLAAYISPTLAEIVYETNTHSQNLFAELLLKTLGAQSGQVGSFGSGSWLVLKFLQDLGVPLEPLCLVDGSGLSRLNRVTARTLVAALRAVDAAPWRDVFRESLPVGAKNGTLRKRFYNNRTLAPNIRAKTGYLRGARALSGWATQADGSEYRFSIVINGSRDGIPGGINWIDRAAIALVTPTTLNDLDLVPIVPGDPYLEDEPEVEQGESEYLDEEFQP